MICLSIATKTLSEKELAIMCPKGVPLSEFSADAAHNPIKGRVMAAGVYADQLDRFQLIQHRQEQVVIDDVWRILVNCMVNRVTVVGATLTSFDLPYTIWRSWALDIPVPAQVVQVTSGRPVFNPLLIDVQRSFNLGSGQMFGFDTIGELLGTGGRSSDFTPGTFAAAWRRNRRAAIKWLHQEVRQPIEWARRMGIK